MRSESSSVLCGRNGKMLFHRDCINMTSAMMLMLGSTKEEMDNNIELADDLADAYSMGGKTLFCGCPDILGGVSPVVLRLIAYLRMRCNAEDSEALEIVELMERFTGNKVV